MASHPTTDIPADVTTFPGFPAGTLPYLRALRDHADREWFAAHRDDYLTCYDLPAKALVRALADRLPELSAEFHADPTVGGSIFRVNRDRRFSPDALPYKGYLDLWFWEGQRALAPGGLYLRLTPETVRFGVGARRSAARPWPATARPCSTTSPASRWWRWSTRWPTPASRSRGSGCAAPRAASAPTAWTRGEPGCCAHTSLYVDTEEPAEGLIASPAVSYMSAESPSVQRSFRLARQTAHQLDAAAAAAGESRNALAHRLLREALRTEQHPLIRSRRDRGRHPHGGRGGPARA